MEEHVALEQLNHNVTVPDALTRRNGGPDCLCCVRTSGNAVFRFQRSNTGYYLRVAHDGPIDLREETFALRFLSHLWRAGAAVYEPIASVSNTLSVKPLQEVRNP